MTPTTYQQACAIINQIRIEKEPPLARYSMLLILAAHSPKPMTGAEITSHMGDTSSRTSTLERMTVHGLVTATPTNGRSIHYRLTPAGIKEATRIATGHPPKVPTAVR